ncbi:hypothetical protein SAMN05880590_108117 [Rhizobium sp. RU35A]|uniref:hypothetical protein n=1 Tax=Rhizobium sp. RU35A TaxID=1907414 RepID=UPI000956D5A0|nr:hypothetical protein [Rhizobium sp. RU35A]SIQ88102.1 hypothetical protein SAMN05880590_108117 [Rhizobium sp. RU35A]
MQNDIEMRLEIASEIMERLVSQNLLLVGRIMALENIAAYAVAQQFSGERIDRDGLSRFVAEVSGTAVRISDAMHGAFTDDTRPLELPKTMERVLSMAEAICDARSGQGLPSPVPLQRLS